MPIQARTIAPAFDSPQSIYDKLREIERNMELRQVERDNWAFSENEDKKSFAPTEMHISDTPSKARSVATNNEGRRMTPIEQYIRQAAQARGINPDIAVRVAKSEGGLNDPYRQAEATLSYGREQSYGPFQLHLPKGLGKEALAAGVDPRKDWQGGVDFALDAAKRGGWGPWFGAKKIGITGMQGINGGGGGPSAPALPGKIGGDSMVARDFDPQVAAQTNAPFGGQGGTDTMFGGGGLLAQRPINPELAALAGDEEKSPMAKLGGLLSQIGEAIPNAPQPNLGPMPDARRTGGLLTEFLSNMKRRA